MAATRVLVCTICISTIVVTPTQVSLRARDWFRVLDAFRTGSRWSLVELRSKNALNHRIVDDSVPGESKGSPFPFSVAAAEALLRNSMRALATQVPLEEVALTLPN